MSMILKTPRGTTDYEPDLFNRYNKIINIIRSNALNMGAVEIDTPIIELTQNLLNKYGEEAESKLIYRLEKLGREENSLRYDLTVPLQRYIQQRNLENLKRFQVGKVFRKDTPYMNQGRFREFVQADLDIVGDYRPMVPEVEIMKLIVLSMNQIGFSENSFIVRINFRDNLFDIVVNKSKIPSEKFKDVCSSIDKLDKHPWEYVERELREIRQLKDEQIRLLQETLRSSASLLNQNSAYSLFIKYCKLLEIDQYIKYDPYLARGLDYYTGLIYEVVSTDSELIQKAFNNNNRDDNRIIINPTLIAGGRYDNLLTIKKKKTIPAIGVSFGITRLEMMVRHMNDGEINDKLKVFVVADEEYLIEKIRIVSTLRNYGIQTEYDDKPRKVIKQINYGIKNNFQFIVIYGENEKNEVTIKKNDQSADVVIPIDKLFEYLEEYL